VVVTRSPLTARNLAQLAGLTALALVGVIALAYGLHALLLWVGL
jgi:hypothetical protein